ncbi:MAG: imidazoleglycerol-phosphate dehydratase HisB [Planctomycetota bacterium]
MNTQPARSATIERTTRETSIRASVGLDGVGRAEVSTGIGFLDHMLTALAAHSLIDITLSCEGDLGVDDHHTAEDCAIVLGSAIDRALGDRSGVARFGSAYAPMDEALARVAIDLSGRAHAGVDLRFTRETVGAIATENITHVFVSLSQSLRCALHADVLKGSNDHHKAEAAFKALALALRGAVSIDPRRSGIASTKGVL